MKLAIVFRYLVDSRPGRENRMYIQSEMKHIFDELNVQLVPVVSEIGCEEIAKECDGLILPGSAADTHPKYYGEEVMEGKNYDIDEYAFDSKMIKLFADQNKPILGICGGHQEINVFFGGTLNQRIENHENNDTHHITVKEGSFIYDAYKSKDVMTNTHHFQSVKDVAPGFTITAVADDNTIEAIEKGNIISVQWHPEVSKDMSFFKKFISLIK